MGRGLWEMTDAALEGHWRGHMSSRGRTCPLRRGRGGGRLFLPTLPGETGGPGNAANLELTDSTHLSVWSQAFPGAALARLAALSVCSYYKNSFSKQSAFLRFMYVLQKALCCRFIKYYIYKSPPSRVPCSFACHGLRVSDSRAPALYFISVSLLPLSPSLSLSCTNL